MGASHTPVLLFNPTLTLATRDKQHQTTGKGSVPRTAPFGCQGSTSGFAVVLATGLVICMCLSGSQNSEKQASCLLVNTKDLTKGDETRRRARWEGGAWSSRLSAGTTHPSPESCPFGFYRAPVQMGLIASVTNDGQLTF